MSIFEEQQQQQQQEQNQQSSSGSSISNSSNSGKKRPRLSVSSSSSSSSRMMMMTDNTTLPMMDNNSNSPFISTTAAAEASSSSLPAAAAAEPADNNNNSSSTSSTSSSSSSSVMVAVRIRPMLALEAGADRCLEVLHSYNQHQQSSASSRKSCTTAATYYNTIRIGGSSSGVRFCFDHVYDSTAQQQDIYVHSIVPLVQCALQGFNATCLAYGQTGSGKTFTMMGEQEAAAGTTTTTTTTTTINNDVDGTTPTTTTTPSRSFLSHQHHHHHNHKAGIIPRALKSLFDALEHEKQQVSCNNNCSNNNNNTATATTTFYDYTVRMQFLELYGEDIRDLLCSSSNSSSNNGNNNRLTIRDVGNNNNNNSTMNDEPEVVGATQLAVESAEEALRHLHAGMLRRVTAATAMNQSSSRSHAILSIVIEQELQQTTTTIAATNEADDGNAGEEEDEQQQQCSQIIKRSKFNFVDLAGSERQKKTHAVGQRLKEGIDINKGLLVLGNVISALGDPKKRRQRTFVPYRDSKLTRLLKGSLGGNAKTLMIACVSPAETNLEESLNCLRYANRAKNIQNNAVMNVNDRNNNNNATTTIYHLRKMVAALQSQVHVLATALLERINGKVATEEPTRGVLEALLVKKAGAGMDMTAAGVGMGMGMNSSTTVTPRKLGLDEAAVAGGEYSDDDNNNYNNNNNNRVQQLEAQLQQTRHELRQTQMNHDAAEEQLYVAKAEKELYQLQLSVLTTTTTSMSPSPNHHGNGNASKNNKNLPEHHDVFLNRAKEYEKQISQLRAALCVAEAKLSTQTTSDWLASSSPGLRKAQSSLEEDRERLEQLQLALSAPSDEISHDGDNDDDDVVVKLEEEKAEEEQVQELTQKYLQASGYREDDDDDGEEEEADKGERDGSVVHDDDNDEVPVRSFQADLIELSRSIAAKEELIDQLKLSQEKYATMREFYEEKLKQMESALAEREAEREHLIQQLQEAKESDVAGKEQLEDRLREKDEHIAGLRQKHKQLKDLTAVSARNSDDIARLQNDVKEMKRRKVDLQKLLKRERKEHATELKRLQKEAIQKDRELSKMKQFNAKKEEEARRANNIAKTRLDELGQLRAKYKDTEKKLRLLSVKRGVMAKAGIDPVLVGRRALDNKKHRKESPASSQKLDSDVMRDYFDKRVASVVRKEALADKLAQEWEEHFELTTRLEQLKEHPEEENGEDTAESLMVQIQFKEDRIRRLAQRLGNQEVGGAKESGNEKATSSNSFLFDTEFAKICQDTEPEASADAVAKVLFGMVVRERRRVAALARSASSLDERLQAAEKAASISEEALRTYMDEQNEERAILSQNQQEQILSLMDVVKDVSEGNYGENAIDPSQHGAFDSTMLLLANERILALEQEISELRSQSHAQDVYKEKSEELKQTLQSKSQEFDVLQDDVDVLRDTLRKIKKAATRGGEECLWTIVDIVNGALNPTVTTRCKKSTRTKRGRFDREDSNYPLSTRNIAKKPTDSMESAESSAGEDEGLHDWAKEIMDDLALIAEGKMPPSLEGVAKESSVFDRLSDPQSFTGTQKLVREGKKPSPTSDDRRAMSREISNRLEQVVPEDVSSVPSHTPSNESIESTSKDSGSEGKTYKSVFERLISPSHYTGTQRGKHERKAKRGRGSDKSTRKVLDGVLESKESRENTDEKRKDTKESGGDRTDYIQQDVFERLQKTTTQAYAVKHNGTLLPDGYHFDESHTHASKHGEGKREAKASHHEASTSPPSHPPATKHEETRSHVQPDYTLQNVFERLQKTTTEAYAKKTNKAKKEQVV